MTFSEFQERVGESKDVRPPTASAMLAGPGKGSFHRRALLRNYYAQELHYLSSRVTANGFLLEDLAEIITGRLQIAQEEKIRNGK